MHKSMRQRRDKEKYKEKKAAALRNNHVFLVEKIKKKFIPAVPANPLSDFPSAKPSAAPEAD